MVRCPSCPLPAWLTPVGTLLLHLFDTGSDALQCWQQVTHGHYCWAIISASFVLIAGLVSAALAFKQKVRGLRLLLYVVGLGPLVEVLMKPAIIFRAEDPQRFVWVRACETLLEAMPSLAFKFYLLESALEHSNDGLTVTVVDAVSLLFSVLSAGYGVMAMLREQKVGTSKLPAAHSVQGSVGVALLVVFELVLYVLPVSVLFSDPEYRPWSIVAVPAALLAFELLLAFSYHRRKDLAYYASLALAACYSIAPHVMNLWRHEGTVRSLWLSHFVQLLARVPVLWLTLRGYGSETARIIWIFHGAVAVVATVLVSVVADADRKYPLRTEKDAPKEEEEGREDAAPRSAARGEPNNDDAADDGEPNALLCGCI